MFRAVLEPRTSGKSAKSLEIHKNTQNTAKFGKNPIKYLSLQHIWNLFQLLGLFSCCERAIYIETSSLKRAANVPKLPGAIMLRKTGH